MVDDIATPEANKKFDLTSNPLSSEYVLYYEFFRTAQNDCLNYLDDYITRAYVIVARGGV